jgi:hypothetical protein
MNGEIAERFEKTLVSHLRCHINIYMKLVVRTVRNDSVYPLFKASSKLSLLNKYKYESDQ